MLKHLACGVCRVGFSYDHRKGPTRQRCDTCTIARKRATDAVKAQRWRNADPVRSKAAEIRSNEKRARDPEHLRWKRENEMRRSYGLTRADYDAIHEKQGGLCAICCDGHVGPGNQLHVDHDHKSGTVRGLLCAKCNTLLGLADDDPLRLTDAAAYLLRTSANTAV